MAVRINVVAPRMTPVTDTLSGLAPTRSPTTGDAASNGVGNFDGGPRSRRKTRAVGVNRAGLVV